MEVWSRPPPLTHPRPRPLAGLLAELPDLRLHGEVADLAVIGITHDSKVAQPGDLFAALPGDRAHGARFAEPATAAGAVAVLTDDAGLQHAAGCAVPVITHPRVRQVLGRVASWVYDEPSGKLDVYGVTGTDGKTTTSFLMEAGLRGAGRRVGLIGTVETRLDGRPLYDVAPQSRRTTPEATELQHVLALMRERGAQAVAMEVSSHGLALHRVAGVRFRAGVFTNLSHEHLDFHGDLESYFAAKSRLFRAEVCALAVVNADDDYGRRLSQLTDCPVQTYSVRGGGEATWTASSIEPTDGGSTFRCRGPHTDVAVRLTLPGRFNVGNALGALAALVATGVPAGDAAGGITRFTRVPGRMQWLREPDGFGGVRGLIDYAHTPGGLAAMLSAVREHTRGRVLLVFGTGGARDVTKRPPLGAAAAEGADVVVLTADDPRWEDPNQIIEALRRGALTISESRRARILLEPDRADAIWLAAGLARRDDTVVVAGKGHERMQIIEDRVEFFDDEETLRAALGSQSMRVSSSSEV